jgi:hypothetical protein
MEKLGFYKETEDGWFYAPNYVYSKDYELLKDKKDEYIFPIDGWYWYDSEPDRFIEV